MSRTVCEWSAEDWIVVRKTPYFSFNVYTSIIFIFGRILFGVSTIVLFNICDIYKAFVPI
jgi:hypothetical protein